MQLGTKIPRTMALTAALLLVWCHTLEPSFHGGRGLPATQQPVPAGTMLAAPAPPPEVPSQVSCCFGGAGSNLLSASLSKAPVLSAPLLAVLLSLLLSFALPWPARGATRSLARNRAGLVQQSVLIRI